MVSGDGEKTKNCDEGTETENTYWSFALSEYALVSIDNRYMKLTQSNKAIPQLTLKNLLFVVNSVLNI